MVWNFCLIWIILSKSASFCDLVMQIYYATYCTYFMDIPLLGYIIALYSFLGIFFGCVK